MKRNANSLLFVKKETLITRFTCHTIFTAREEEVTQNKTVGVCVIEQ
jgi:hypothetical protein